MLLMSFDTPEERDKFIVLYETYKHYILYTIRLFVQDSSVIEDLSQDIYLIIGEHLDKIDLSSPSRTRNYLITIARNYCKNYLRRKSRTQEIPLDLAPDPPSTDDDILNHIIDLEQVHLLSQRISRLDDISKTILELKYINDFTNEQIADFMHMKKKTVELRLYRIKLHLQTDLGE